MWSVGCLLIWCLSVLDCVAGVVETTVECGSGATVGQPYVLTCGLNGTIVNGISWFRGNDASSIITCFSDRNCVSNNPTLYSVTTPHPVDKQQFTILNVTSDDILQSWRCGDGLSLPSVSGCNLEKATTTPAVTTSLSASTSTTGGGQSSVIDTGTSDSATTTVDISSPGSDELSGGVIAGIVIGVLAVAAAVGGGVACCFLIYKKKNRKDKK